MIININNIEIKRVTPKDSHFFFGYYDISPESPDGSKILINKAPFIDRMPRVGDELIIGYIDSESFEFHQIGLTTAWTFQEGCRLQWLDNDRIIYINRSTNGSSFHSFVYSISEKVIVREYERPVYSITADGKYAVSYSFFNNRYSYAHNEEEEVFDYDNDGIFLTNLQTGESKLLLPLSFFAEKAGALDRKNWIEHCVFNPKGDRFYLYHRWLQIDGKMSTRMYESDLEGNCRVLLDTSFCSHSGWRGDREITTFGRLPNRFNAVEKNDFLRKTGIFKIAVDLYHFFVRGSKARMLVTNDSYIMIDLDEHTCVKLDNKDFVGDGHCTWSKDKRYMLTDSYAINHERYLFIYDFEADKLYNIRKFCSLPSRDHTNDTNWDESGMRCDLHPKWSFSENHIFFDSVHEGFRGLYRIKTDELFQQIKKINSQ